MLSPVKCFEIHSKHNGFGFITDFVALNWWKFKSEVYKKLLAVLKNRFKQNFCLGLVIVVSYNNPSVELGYLF